MLNCVPHEDDEMPVAFSLRRLSVLATSQADIFPASVHCCSPVRREQRAEVSRERLWQRLGDRFRLRGARRSAVAAREVMADEVTRHAMRHLAEIQSGGAPLGATLDAVPVAVRDPRQRAAAERAVATLPVLPTIDAPQLPTILLHGMGGDLPMLPCFGGIREDLVACSGADVMQPYVPRYASIHKRAQVLADFIEGVAATRRGGSGNAPPFRCNLIAHSMGGLDARHYVTALGGHARVASVTTLGSPHLGSEWADLFLENDLMRGRSGARAIKRVDGIVDARPRLKRLLTSLDTWFPATGPAMDRLLSRDVTKGLQRWMEEKSFVEYDSVFHLTTRYVRDEFNPATPNHPDVRYFALAGDITSGAFGTRPGPLAHTRFFLPHAVIRRKEGANDGLVSIDSALGAGLGGGETGTPAFESLGVVGLDHAELINQSRRYDGRALFRLILHNLAKNGF